MKKAISLILAVLLLGAIIPTKIFAVENPENEIARQYSFSDACIDESGHSFGQWSQFATSICQLSYRRQCEKCGVFQHTKDITEQIVTYSVPAITSNVGDLIMLEHYSVYFDENTLISHNDITWTSDFIEINENCIIPTKAGVFKLVATAKNRQKSVYLVIKNSQETEYTLYFDDFENSNLEDYRVIKNSNLSSYYISDGNLVLDSVGSDMRLLLPAFLGDFGDYRIETEFSMLEAANDMRWFSVMARTQNKDCLYWQAVIRKKATLTNGTEIAARIMSSNGIENWNVTHKAPYSQDLLPYEYHTLTFNLNGNNATHAIDGEIILESDTITNKIGDVGFQVNSAKVLIDRVRIVLTVNEPTHNFGNWVVKKTNSCTEDGYKTRTCAYCEKTETEIIAASHNLAYLPAKEPTCTESGWLGYEFCNRCDYVFKKVIPANLHSYARKINSVAHRGYSYSAPENTLAAYIMAKENGFDFAECDVSFTADGVAVLLHDSTIDRTSNGSGNVSALTYEELLQYDFGGWKSEKYKGTKIPTFEEFIALCAKINIHPYIELKGHGGYNQEKIQQLVDVVKKYGMSDNSTWISFGYDILVLVKNADPSARLGFLAGSDATNEIIEKVKRLKTETNEVFLDLSYGNVTKQGALRAKANNMPLEVYTVNSKDAILKMYPQISGVTSDYLVAQSVVRDQNAVVTAPTCFEAGYTTYTCSDCGNLHTDNYTKPMNHSIMVRTILKEQTCSENGKWLLECLNCEYSETVEIAATKEHKYDNPCDADCNECGKERDVDHAYKSYKTTDATTSKNGKKYYKCEDCGATKISTIYKASKISLSTEEYTYNGKTKKPSVKVYDSKGKKLDYGDDYTYSRPSSSKNVGKYKIKVTFKGDYTGTKTLYYTINPKATKVSSVTAAKKSLKVKISKQSTQTTGYQIQYSTSSKFKSAKTKTISSYKTTSYTIKSLSAKKYYYVRVRTYKTVNGTKYYSDWSKSVKKKTK